VAAISRVSNVRLRVFSQPENVLLVRQALRGLAETVDLDEIELNDITTAVTEACNNVVSHAYGEHTGSLEVEISGIDDSLEVLVRDHGVGIGDAADESDFAQDEQVEGGIGLPVMRALADRLSFEEAPGGGTEVRMVFSLDKLAGLEAALDSEHVGAVPTAHDAISISVGPARLARPVLRRVLSAVAARARFSSARVTETQRLADGLVAHLVGSGEENRLTTGVSIAHRNLELTVGPLREGSSVDGLAPLLKQLDATHQVDERSDGAEILAVRLVEPT
jgi:serine/threonine-protein kinase RsbW